jgi:hypothetical protein
MENGKYPYQKDWEEYKRRQKAFWLVFLGYIPFMFLFNVVLADLFRVFSFGENVSFFCFIVFGVVWIICGIRLQYWKCPQCRNSFHAKWWWRNIFSSKCLHCKLPKYEGSSFYNDRLWNANR